MSWKPWQHIEREHVAGGNDVWVTVWRAEPAATRILVYRKHGRVIAKINVSSPIWLEGHANTESWEAARAHLVECVSRDPELAASKLPAALAKLRAPEGL